MTYAERWADAINETYTDDAREAAAIDCRQHGEDDDAAILRVLTKAADCLRGGETHTFSGDELDLVRHLMPAHEVHQSGTRRWVLDNYGSGSE